MYVRGICFYQVHIVVGRGIIYTYLLNLLNLEKKNFFVGCVNSVKYLVNLCFIKFINNF